MDNLSRLYDNLSRYTYYIQWLRKRQRPDFISMHKPMLIPVEDRESSPDTLTSEDLDGLCYRLVQLPDNPTVLDVGCGFGATLFKWQGWRNGVYHGYTNSQFQVKIARKIAQRRGVSNQCLFYLKSFEENIKEQYDTIVAIEALIHAGNTKMVLENLVNALNPGGRIIIADDFLRKQLPSETKSYRILKEAWYLSGLIAFDPFLEMISKSGLELIEHRDLSSLVSLASADKITSRLKSLGLIQRILPVPGIRLFLKTHQGGYALQRLYREGLMGYYLIVARKPM